MPIKEKNMFGNYYISISLAIRSILATQKPQDSSIHLNMIKNIQDTLQSVS
jgi:hypothetical protein